MESAPGTSRFSKGGKKREDLLGPPVALAASSTPASVDDAIAVDAAPVVSDRMDADPDLALEEDAAVAAVVEEESATRFS